MGRMFLALCTVALATAVLGCSVSVTAVPPQPNYAVQKKLPGPVTAQVVGATDEEMCSKTPGIKDLCVTGLKSALQAALERMAQDYSGEGQRSLAATLEVVDFTLVPAAVTAAGSAVAVMMQMRWKFTVQDAAGHQVVALADTTTGPKAVAQIFAADDAFAALEATVLEDISKQLNGALGQTASTPPPPAAETTPPPAADATAPAEDETTTSPPEN